MRHSVSSRDICRCSEAQLRKLLADEHWTAQRQQLLKALWKLSQQREQADSIATATKRLTPAAILTSAAGHNDATERQKPKAQT